MPVNKRDVEAGWLEDAIEGMPLLPIPTTIQLPAVSTTALLPHHDEEGPSTKPRETTVEKDDTDRISIAEHKDEDIITLVRDEHSSRDHVPRNIERDSVDKIMRADDVVFEENEALLTESDIDKKAESNIEQKEIAMTVEGADNEINVEGGTEELIKLDEVKSDSTLHFSGNLLGNNGTCGRKSDALHKAVLVQDMTELDRLLAAGYYVGAHDALDRTPLHLCVEHKLLEPLKVLLKAEGATEVTNASGYPVLHFAVKQRWRLGVQAVLAAGADITTISPSKEDQKSNGDHTRIRITDDIPQNPIHLAVKSGDMAMLNDILIVAEERNVMDCFNRAGESPLYIAIKQERLDIVEALLKRGASVHKVSDRKESALHIAVGHPRVLQYLLDNTDATVSFDLFYKAPIHNAVLKNEPSSLRKLIDKFGDIRLKTAKPNSSKNCTALEFAVKYGLKQATEVLLDADIEGIHVANDSGDSALHVAIKNDRIDMVDLLLKNGALLSAKGKDGVTAIEMIATKFFNPTEFFEHLFDKYIYMDDPWVHVDYTALTNTTGMSQIKALEEFVKCGQSSVLKHPLLESLLFLKWKRLLPLFCCLIALFVVYLVTFNIFVVTTFYNIDTNGNAFNTSLTIENLQLWFRAESGWYWLMIALIYTSIFFLLDQEMFYIKLKRFNYFLHLESWVKLCGFVLGALTPIAALLEANWPRHVASAALLLGWLQAMFLLARFPNWGNYVLMFGKVAINIFKIFVTTIFLVFGFAFCFMIQYRSAAPFDGPFSAFVKTLVMMSSEFDYEDLFGEDHMKELQDTRTIVRFLFVLFVIFVAIVLMNFMIGVAVSDINELNMTGKIRVLEKQLELLSSMDILSKMEGVTKVYKKMRKRRYHISIKNIMTLKNDWYVKVDSEDVLDNQYMLHFPSELTNDIIDVAKKKAQRTEKEQIKSDYRSKIDEMFNLVVRSVRKKEQRDLEEHYLNLTKEVQAQNEQIKSLDERLISVQQEINSSNQNFLKLENDISFIKKILTEK